MRIIHIVNHFLPSPGGVEWSVLRTAEAQSRQGDDVTVITETSRGDYNDDALPFRVLRFRVHLLRPLTRVFYWQWMWKHRDMLAAADVLHFHDYTPFFHWFIPLRFVLRRPLYAITFHGFEHWPVKLRHRMMRGITARLCHLRFAVGEYVRKIYRHPVDVVYLGAPVRSVQSRSPSPDPVFVYAGRLEEDTGILETARALSRTAATQGIAVHLEIAGEGRQRHALESLRSPHFRITFHGRVEDPERLFAHARFVIAAGFLGMFEAMQSGLPVLVPALTDIRKMYAASIPDVDALMTVMRSPEGLEKTLAESLQSPLADAFLRRAEAARMFVSEHTWKDIAELLAASYSAAMNARNRSSERMTGGGVKTEH
ncbi:glycosyltransferase family 4 protein [bacterium]|nr:glycosyltransferase family 4 protein [bacterium]